MDVDMIAEFEMQRTEITMLKARILQLEEALRPFAQLAARLDDGGKRLPDETAFYTSRRNFEDGDLVCTFGHARAARKVLEDE
jgi:hypothetical protein